MYEESILDTWKEIKKVFNNKKMQAELAELKRKEETLKLLDHSTLEQDNVLDFTTLKSQLNILARHARRSRKIISH